MASTINKANLTVTLKEQVKINNQEYGNRNSIEIGGVNDVSQRIISVPVADTTILLKLSGSVGAGTFGIDNLKYARLTNLDNQNWVRLSFISSSDTPASFNRYDVKLEARQSYIFTNSAVSGSQVGADFNAFAKFTDLKAKADTAAVDLELFIATS